MPRWGDGTYATRIFISQIIGNEWDKETGFGISGAYVFEESYTPVTVNFDTRQVTYGEHTESFSDFVGVN